jgi:hypothetical protein
VLTSRARVMAAGLAVIVAPLVILATTGTAAMASDSTCSDSVALEGFNLCMGINGSGQHINYAQASFYVGTDSGAWDNMHLELIRPSGKRIKNCPQVNVQPGKTIYCKWSPNAKEAPGKYCAIAWQRLDSGQYNDRAKECVPVK